jgi:hypothetical protein
MAGPVPAIHVFLADSKDVDARHKAGHDEARRYERTGLLPFPYPLDFAAKESAP